MLGWLWTAHPADWGVYLFPSFWNLWGQIWCAVSRFGFLSRAKILQMEIPQEGHQEDYRVGAQIRSISMWREWRIGFVQFEDDQAKGRSYCLLQPAHGRIRRTRSLTLQWWAAKWMQLAVREIWHMEKYLNKNTTNFGTSNPASLWNFCSWRRSKCNWAVKQPDQGLKLILLWSRNWSMWPPGSPPT